MDTEHTAELERSTECEKLSEQETIVEHEKITDWKTLVPALESWHRKNRRPLPWRRDREPYHVWVSEIMLQQTRIEAVIPYYERFMRELPSLESLAEVDEECLLKLWEGLGYYSRARNLKRAARMIMEKYGGEFPGSEKEILALPGIGPYTAGAILSISFGKPVPAVDGNVLRVYARLAALQADPGRPQVKNSITEELREAYQYGEPGMVTEGLMALGQEICIPRGKPRCPACPFSSGCRAHEEAREQEYPLRPEKKKRTKEKRVLAILLCGGKVAIAKRKNAGLLAGLWEFPAVPAEPALLAEPTLPEEPASQTDADLQTEPAPQTDANLKTEAALQTETDFQAENRALRYAEALGLHPEELLMVTEYTHIFTHKEWEMKAVYIRCKNRGGGLVWAAPEELRTVYALPSAFRPFAEQVLAKDAGMW